MELKIIISLGNGNGKKWRSKLDDWTKIEMKFIKMFHRPEGMEGMGRFVSV